jgi:alpha-galactosidase
VRTWTLRGAETAYTVGVPDHGGWAELAAWGPAAVADGPSAVTQIGTVHFVAPADLAPLEYAVHGVRYTGAVELKLPTEYRPVFVAADNDDENLALTFTDRSLRLLLRYRMPAGLDVVERWVEVHNDGPDDLVLRGHDSAAFVVPTSGAARLGYLWGQWSTEFQHAEVTLPRGRFEIGSRQGVTGHSFSPYMSVQEPGGGGTAWGVELAWTGSWHLSADVEVTGQTRIQAGRVPGSAGVVVRPGASWSSPVAVGGCSGDGIDGLARVFHAYQRSLAGDRLDRPRPVIYNSWEATGFDVHAGHQLGLAERAVRAGVETFVVDDGWFTGRDGDTAGLGDWYVDEQAFPGGLEPFVARLRELGLDFGLWVEPESVNPGSELAADHPDWILRTPDHEPLLVRNQLLLDLGNDEVAAWVGQTLDRLLAAYDIRYLKWDANRARLDGGDVPGRDVDGEAVTNLYAILDRLRAEHPRVYVEGCSGGGARVDLGMAARVDTLWPSDNTGPLDRLAIQRGFLTAWSPHLMTSWVSDAPGLHDTRPRGLDFRFHVAMAGGLGIGADLSGWSGAQLETARHWVDRYREVRDLVSHGYVYRLTAPDVVGLQYVGEDRSLVLLYDVGDARTGSALPARPRRVPVAALDAGGTYRAGDEVLSGRYLMGTGAAFPAGAESLCLIVEPLR